MKRSLKATPFASVRACRLPGRQKHVFEWGSFTLACRVDGGKVQEAEVYTDAMDWEALAGAGQFFKGCAFTPEALAQAAQKNCRAGRKRHQ